MHRSLLLLFLIPIFLLAAVTSAQGDGDQDGVPDGADQCPNQPGSPNNNGCPGNPPPSPSPPPQDAPPPAEDNGAPAQPTDRDGDGIPDNQDACPDAAAPNGCPPPPDDDSDGIPNEQDSCPNAAGQSGNNGCPLPRLPQEGACVLATRDAYRVNVRETPFLDSAIVGQIAPSNLYPVLGRATLTAEIWFQIDLGWVNSEVTRTGGDCEQVPLIVPTGGAPIPEPRVGCPMGRPLIVRIEGATLPASGFDPRYGDFADSLTAAYPTPDTVVSGPNYTGNGCDEIIFGTAERNIINGMGGRDIIYGGGGRDILLGLDGDDFLGGGDGNDLLLGGSNADTLVDDAGVDFMMGNQGNDTLHNTVTTEQTQEYSYGGADNDTLITYTGMNPVMYGEAGDDVLRVLACRTCLVDGGRGNDRIEFRPPIGEPLPGGASPLFGNSGDDIITVWGGQRIVVYGGSGNDTIIYEGGPLADFLLAYGNEENDILISIGAANQPPQPASIEFEGNDGDDTLVGVGLLRGNEGNDIIVGMLTEPYGSYGRQPADRDGGAGDDFIALVSYGWQAARGGDGDDTLTGTESNDWLQGGADNDHILGNGGHDRLAGEAGNDVLIGGMGMDSVNGGIGDDVLAGLVQAETCDAACRGSYTGEWPNLLNGGEGNDTLYASPIGEGDVCILPETTTYNCDLRARTSAPPLTERAWWDRFRDLTNP